MGARRETADRSKTEIERKFLLDLSRLPDLAGSPSRLIEQGYVAACAGSEVRVRTDGERRTLTVKKGAGLSRQEIEVALTSEQFHALWAATEGARIRKRRHSIALGRHTAEVDVYLDDLAGLAVAEVEFCSLSDARTFAPPAWFGPEVTGRPEYSNASLALKGLPERGTERL